jgi:hypothetical protein
MEGQEKGKKSLRTIRLLTLSGDLWNVRIDKPRLQFVLPPLRRFPLVAGFRVCRLRGQDGRNRLRNISTLGDYYTRFATLKEDPQGVFIGQERYGQIPFHVEKHLVFGSMQERDSLMWQQLNSRFHLQGEGPFSAAGFQNVVLPGEKTTLQDTHHKDQHPDCL